MKYTKKNIMHENGKYWVLDTRKSYAVMKDGVFYAVIDSEYFRDEDGLSVAIARCEYLAEIDAKKKNPRGGGGSGGGFDGSPRKRKR